MSSEGRRWLEPRALRAWLLVAACVAVIFILSGDAFSAQMTYGRSWRLLRWLFPDASWQTIYELHHWIRKAAHPIEYGVLALLAYRAAYLSAAGTLLRHAGIALALVFAVAGVDEIRQGFSHARTGSLRDVSLDVAGGLVALCLVASLRRSARAARESPTNESA